MRVRPPSRTAVQDHHGESRLLAHYVRRRPLCALGGFSVPARFGKGQGAKEIGHNLARERPKFGHNLVRKRHKIGHSLERE